MKRVTATHTVQKEQVEAYRQAVLAFEKAEQALAKSLQENFPVGSLHEFCKGRGRIEAIIMGHSGGTHPKVEIYNINTGSEYWIDAWWLLQTEAPDWW